MLDVDFVEVDGKHKNSSMFLNEEGALNQPLKPMSLLIARIFFLPLPWDIGGSLF